MRYEFDTSELSRDGNPSHNCNVNVLTSNMAYLRISTESNFFHLLQRCIGSVDLSQNSNICEVMYYVRNKGMRKQVKFRPHELLV